MNDLTETFKGIICSDDDYPVDFDQAWEWIGYSRKDSALRVLSENFKPDEDYSAIRCTKKNPQKSGNLPSYKTKPSSIYFLTMDCFKSFCMMAGTEQGKQVRRYFLNCEKLLREMVIEQKAYKITRRELTDIIQTSPLNEAQHGFAYKNFTDLIYKQVLGMDAKHYRECLKFEPKANLRPHLTQIQLNGIQRLEKLVGSMVDLGAEYEQIKAAVVGFGKKSISDGRAA